VTKKRSNSKKPVTLISAIMLIVGLAVLAGYWAEQSTVIEGVEFRGYHFTAPDELEATIDSRSPVGVKADSVDYRSLIETVSALPYVKDVKISMGRRGVLTFSVTEREPLAMLVDGNRRSYVAEGGIRLPLVTGKSVDVPLVYGFPAEPLSDTLKSDGYRQVEEFLTEARNNRFTWITISEVAWNEREGVVALTAENGVKLLFGHSGFDRSVRHWQEFYQEVVAVQGIRSFNQIDLRFRNQIVTQES
jgi:cell division protein FtsQ